MPRGPSGEVVPPDRAGARIFDRARRLRVGLKVVSRGEGGQRVVTTVTFVLGLP